MGVITKRKIVCYKGKKEKRKKGGNGKKDTGLKPLGH
jgi:hypothetical protein